MHTVKMKEYDMMTEIFLLSVQLCEGGAMWGGAGGWWCGALAAGALLLLVLAQRCRRRKRPRTSIATHTVHIVRDAFPARLPQPPRVTHPSLPFPVTPIPPRRILATLAGAPADDPQHPPPQIVIVQNSTQNTIAQGQNPEPSSSTAQPEFKGIPKLPLPEQWIHKRPLDCKYTATIPRPLAQIVNADLGSDLNQETRAKKFSATRSPSLEKDEKSPFVSSAKADRVFGFDMDIVNKLKEEEMSERRMSKEGEGSQDASPSNLRRFRSVSTRLNMCSVSDGVEVREQQERLEMQNSPRVIECSSAKEKSAAPKFDFSPKMLADTITSPRFFTPPETVSPMFFAEPSPKSVYYDSVRSPKFFPDTPRDIDVPHSPRTLGDHLNRNGIEKPSSPKILSARPSPKVHSYNKENYFTFDPSCPFKEDAKMSPKPRKYGGRNSIEKERFTPPADKDIRKYRRHNSCDTNYKTVEVHVNDNKDTKIDNDVVDCCAKMESLKIDSKIEEKPNELTPSPSNTAQARRQRLKSISLDSDNAKIIEQNLGLPIAKQMKDQMNEAYKNQEVSASCESMERYPKTPSKERPMFKFEDNKEREPEEAKSPVKQKKCLRQSSDTQSFLDMPRFSPKEFEITVTSEEGATTSADFQTKPKTKNLRNLTIDLTKRDSELEKELLEFEKLYTDAEEKKVKTPTLKVKATSLDSSETVNLSLPQKKTLEVPQNSISVPNTPKRQLKRILAQKSLKHDPCGAKLGYNSIQSNAEQRRFFMKVQDSGIYLRENHASLMLYQPGTSRMGSRTMGSFDENMTDFTENPPEINISGSDNRYHLDSGQTLGSNLLNYKQNLSVSSTNLKTLPEGVPSDDFEPSVEDEKVIKKLHRRNSNQSLMLSTHSLQGSNCSLNSSGASCHNLATVRTSLSNFSLNSDRQKKLSLERRDSNASLINTDHLTPTTRVICSSNTNLSGEVSKNCLLQRRGSNNSLTLNIYSSNNLSRHSSNSSLNKDAKPGQKKGLLERRSSNTSLTLNINTSNPQLSVNRGLSVSNYNLNGSTCNLSRYNSNHSIDNPTTEPRKGILERRSSNTSLTLNIQAQEPRDLEIDEALLEPNLKDLPHRDKHRKSLSTENLIPKSYKHRTRRSTEKGVGFGSHDNLWSTCYTEADYPQNLTYVCGDQDNEIIYAFGRQDDPNFQQGFVRNITTKPLSPQSTSEDFRLYLANMQHLQNASSVLSRKQLRDLNEVFQNGYSKVKCHNTIEGQHCCSGRVEDMSKENPQMVIPEPVISQPCSEYQKMLLRNLHQEFWDMPTNFQEKPIVSGSHPKNRYKTILPNEHSRFILRNEAGASEGYINANFIKGHEYTKNTYIATQGPLQNTTYDFWLMVHQNTLDYKSRRPPDPGPVPPNYGVQKVVMLTNFIENNRQKCEKYFPLEINEEVEVRNPESEEDNKFVIKNCGMIKKCGYTIRKLDVKFIKSVSYMCASDTGQTNGDTVECARGPSLTRDASIDIDHLPDGGETRTDDSYDQSASVSQSVLSSCESSDVTVYHYWFHNWADHKCPKDVNALLTLSLDVLKNNAYDFQKATDACDTLCKCESPKSESKFLFPPLEGVVPCDVKYEVSTPLDLSVETLSPPTIVHCSAGIGRTGCLIAILNGIKQLTNEQKVDVLGIVCNMRLNRGGMVQNSEQYELIHKVLCLYEQACLPEL
ncbi:hypothetical protein O3G_MSEX003072 [Manduca sexta]|uniref:protein-tyrosine-phosphatase n=2 Tax=Manduca sexta TaxID=7130 RepID=A0A922CF53_MANSE|nr:hypothetical protein O3G_MSEX003072 [Manduca sexta]